MQEKISILINATALFWWVHYTWRLDLVFSPSNLIRKAAECKFCSAFWSCCIASVVAYLFPEFSRGATWVTFPFAAAYLLNFNTIDNEEFRIS
jgi:hypothetical protein